MDKAIIFDWSGTLSDTFHPFSRVCALIFKELGCEPISDDEIRMNYTLPYMKFWNTYFPDLSKVKQEELFEKYIHHVGEPKLYLNVNETVFSLHFKGFKIIIVSSVPDSELSLEIKSSGLLEVIFKFYGNVREKGLVIAELVEKFNLSKSESFYVGDTSGDIDAGKLAGVKTIGITWGFQDKSVLAKSKPDYLVDNIKDLNVILN